MKRIVFILFVLVFSCESTKKVEKKIFQMKSNIKSLMKEIKFPSTVIQNQRHKFEKIILKLIMKKIRRPFVNWMQQKILKIYAPTGELIEGPDAHIGFLSKWFTENNPKWTNSIWSCLS